MVSAAGKQGWLQGGQLAVVDGNRKATVYGDESLRDINGNGREYVRVATRQNKIKGRNEVRRIIGLVSFSSFSPPLQLLSRWRRRPWDKENDGNSRSGELIFEMMQEALQRSETKAEIKKEKREACGFGERFLKELTKPAKGEGKLKFAREERRGKYRGGIEVGKRPRLETLECLFITQCPG